MRDLSLIDVKRLIDLGEGEHLEFKTGVPDIDATARSIAGLANSGGGQLVLGVDPGTRQPLGLADPTAAGQMLENAAKLVTPRVQLETLRADTSGHPVVVANIGSAARPVADPDGAFVRREPSGNRVPLDASELARLPADAGNAAEILKLLAQANSAAVRLQATLDQEREAAAVERKEAAAERKAAKKGRSWKMRFFEWFVAGVIGAILGLIATALVG
jgi:predicted HTH transcriptional regulator